MLSTAPHNSNTLLATRVDTPCLAPPSPPVNAAPCAAARGRQS